MGCEASRASLVGRQMRQQRHEQRAGEAAAAEEEAATQAGEKAGRGEQGRCHTSRTFSLIWFQITLRCGPGW
jgi:hypothetical protein